MQKHLLFFLIASSLCVAASSAMAGADHSLFNPTPDDELRPMATERPSKTDSPYSLDAGRFQIESNLYGYVQNDDCAHGTCAKSRQHFIGGSTNLRIGLTDRMDIQFIGDLYRDNRIDDRTNNTRTQLQGYGDTLVRLKVNAFGNHPADQYSLGVLPYIKLPTNQDNLGNDELEGGIGLPFNINFDGGWNLGGMTQLNVVTDGGSGYDPAYVNSLIVGKALTSKLSAYTEFYTYRADQSGAQWLNTLDFGTVYAVTDNFRIDANVHLGVTDAADDVNFFVGTAYRF
ncbi:MAG: transporter [Alphaproteobacteria bacterium]|nr:MAG: transporter [Alphaproteobacteria bacterium]